MPLVVVAVGINNRDLDAVHQPDRVDANLAIFEAIVDPLDGRTFENPRCIDEGNGVPTDIDKVLVQVPGEPHVRIYVAYLLISSRR